MKRAENMTSLSQQLRKNATPEENTLWYQYLRDYPIRFRRQFVFGHYIVDFYCARAKLVLELDGSQHYDPEGIQKDARRTEYLESLGLMVLRFSNDDIKRNLRGVCERVDAVVKDRMQK
ncbi:MAG: endonuclease domain-containing protein [Candidatus Faecousia sp.]|nr:endonuclease domain-containing protein [Clostridiales bacterium]MDD5882711.1 endonuclease domain-containing protein [Bacillota bacterium]MDY4598117.1 endonuclease domain-containing protein [Candidatus Faecousia sp.]